LKRWAAVFLAFAALAMFFSARDRERRPALSGEAGSTDQVIERFTLEGFDGSGERFWELEGDVAHVWPNTDVFIEKNVKLRIRNTTAIRSDKVLWRNSDSKFMTRMPVEIDHEAHRITGVGAVGRATEEFLQINRDIRMELDGPVLVTCDGPLQIFRAEKRAVFRRGVRIRDTKGTVTADRMDVFFDAETGKATRIVARGSVVITRGRNVSHSDEAVYDTVTQSVKLVGAPRISAHQDDMAELESLKK